MTHLHNIKAEQVESIRNGLSNLSDALLHINTIVGDKTSKIVVDTDGCVRVQNSDLKVSGKLGINVDNVSHGVDFEVAGAIKFQGKKQQVGDKIPTSGLYNAGDIVWIDNPKPNGNLGWICVRAGAPGEWRPFGQIG